MAIRCAPVALLLLLLGACLLPPVEDPARERQDGRVSGVSTDAPAVAGQDQHRSRPRGVPARAQPATVVRHTDGDTLRLRSGRSGPALARGVDTPVRLLEIDTPESVHPGQPDQCFAEEAADRLASLAPLGSRVWAVPDRELTDRYDRTLLYLWNSKGVFVNLRMVRDGFARAVLYPPNDRHIDRMRAAEQRAQAARRGVWAACAFFGQPLLDAG